MPSKNALRLAVVPAHLAGRRRASVMRPPGTSRPMPSSGSIAADSRAVAERVDSGPRRARVAVAAKPTPAELAPQRTAADRQRSDGASSACQCDSLAGGAPASWTNGSRPLSDIRSDTFARCRDRRPGRTGRGTRSAPRTKNSRSPLPLKPSAEPTGSGAAGWAGWRAGTACLPSVPPARTTTGASDRALRCVGRGRGRIGRECPAFAAMYGDSEASSRHRRAARSPSTSPAAADRCAGRLRRAPGT